MGTSRRYEALCFLEVFLVLVCKRTILHVRFHEAIIKMIIINIEERTNQLTYRRRSVYSHNSINHRSRTIIPYFLKICQKIKDVLSGV